MKDYQESIALPGGSGFPHTRSVEAEILSELGRATTAYHEAAPDQFESARLEYEEALRRFRATYEVSQQ